MRRTSILLSLALMAAAADLLPLALILKQALTPAKQGN